MTDFPPRTMFVAPVMTAFRDTLSRRNKYEYDSVGRERLASGISLYRVSAIVRPPYLYHHLIGGLTDKAALFIGDERVESAHRLDT